jgi:hypothetical protein
MKKILLFVLILFSLNAFAQREGRIQKIQFLEGGNIKKSLIKHQNKLTLKRDSVVHWGAYFSTPPDKLPYPLKVVSTDSWIWVNGIWLPIPDSSQIYKTKWIDSLLRLNKLP